MSNQTSAGKSFEFSLLDELKNKILPIAPVTILQNDSYKTSQRCFEGFPINEQEAYRLSARAAVDFLTDLEPRLLNSSNDNDIIQLEVVPDSLGQKGDVRDVLMIRNLQGWEIGISAKNNHRAVKHPRLSNKIDFGKKWIGTPCSKSYFDEISSVFKMLQDLKNRDRTTRWDSIANLHEVIYLPILNAFKKELTKLDQENPDIVARGLVRYLIGNKDFYKVIKGANNVEIQAFNLNGTLNQPFQEIKPKFKVPKLKLPDRLIEMVFENESKTTLLISFNEGWSISFRLHSASSKVEPSLKFDINLVSTPKTLFTNHISIP